MATSKVQLSNLLVKKISHSYSLAAYADENWNPVSEMGLSDYHVVGICGFSTGSPFVMPITISVENSSWGMYIHNMTADVRTASMTYYVLYQEK